MSIAVFTSFGQQLDSSANPLSGGSVYVYAATTTTLLTLYAASDLSGSAAANPIVLDSAGRHDMRYFATAAYKVLVKNSSGSTVYTRDNIDPGIAIGTGDLAITDGGTGASTAPAALSNLGGASAAELADLAADVATLSGTLASSEKTHIATGTTGQRPASPADGDIRKNTTTARYEGVNAALAYENFVTTTTLAADIAALPGPFTVQYLLSGTAQTYTTATSCTAIRVRQIAGGGGGGGRTSGTGATGGTTTFNSITAIGGTGGSSNGGTGGVGGTGGSGGSFRIDGGDGSPAAGPVPASGAGGNGGSGVFGGAGKAGASGAGFNGKANTGGGGGGAGEVGTNSGGSGGGAGEYVEIVITSPAATYTYTVGAGGAGGAAGGAAGGDGGSGVIIVEEYYQ